MLGEVLWLEISLTRDEGLCDGLPGKKFCLDSPRAGVSARSYFHIRARSVRKTCSFNCWSKMRSSNTFSSPPLISFFLTVYLNSGLAPILLLDIPKTKELYLGK